MLNQKEILSTIAMIDQQHLDIRTITMLPCPGKRYQNETGKL